MGTINIVARLPFVKSFIELEGIDNFGNGGIALVYWGHFASSARQATPKFRNIYRVVSRLFGTHKPLVSHRGVYKIFVKKIRANFLKIIKK